jgi:hypothetical protein
MEGTGMRSVMFVVGLLIILYGVVLVGTSVRPPVLSIAVPVPWSDKPATIDNPQLEPGAVLILLGALIAYAAMKR